VTQNIKLTGIITDYSQIPVPTVMDQASDKCCLGSNPFVMLFTDIT